MKTTVNDLFKVALSLLLCVAILYWMYRDFDFGSLRQALLHDMNWMWMLLSFPFGISAQVFRGLRWRQMLDPLGEKPRKNTLVNAVFLSYALSLVVPRVGEFARCGILKRWDGVSFPKSLGTVVTERTIDTALVLCISAITFLTQFSTFTSFFRTTGTRVDNILLHFTVEGWVVTAICGIAAIIIVIWTIMKMNTYHHVRSTFLALWQGISSVKNVKRKGLFALYTIGIWLSYFIHYYLTFYCFRETAPLGAACALVTFVVGTIAVVVPTPNGAGPWHFAVKTMLILYGVGQTSALNFVLIVHAVQTLLVATLGVYAWFRLSFTPKHI